MRAWPDDNGRFRGCQVGFRKGPGPDRWGGEGVFVPREGATAEDDGYVILFVWDEAAQRSECLILDARDIEAPPVATLAIPYRVPFGFLAGWAPARG